MFSVLAPQYDDLRNFHNDISKLNPFPGPWHDPLLVRTTLIENDIVGIDPFNNWITPFDFIPGVGAYAKGYRGVKGLQSAYRLYGHGLGRFGVAKALDAATDFSGIASKIYGMSDNFLQSRGQDRKSGTSVSSVLPKTSRGTKPSRRASPGKTSKPFWSNGKPKCKKGFRYDFKRKLCVKIK